MSKARKELINQWVKANKPDGLGKLARKSKIPYGSLAKIRAGRPVGSELIKASLARALGVKESELFPEDESGKSRAS